MIIIAAGKYLDNITYIEIRLFVHVSDASMIWLASSGFFKMVG